MGGPPGSGGGVANGGVYTGPLGGQVPLVLELGWRPGEGW